jgi:hypothetical protein
MLASERFPRLSIFLLLMFPLITLIFTIFFYLDSFAYFIFMLEGIFPVEMGTFLLMLASGFLTWRMFSHIRKNWHANQWMFIFMTIFFIFGALEEVSYGQSLLNWDTPELLAEVNAQQETNLHNIVFVGPQGESLRLKHVAAMFSFAYGVLLPLLPVQFILRRWLHRLHVVQSPVWLALPFWLTAVISFYDRPIGREEELGEFMMSVCLFVSIWLHYRLTMKAESLEKLESDRLEMTDPAPIYQMFSALPMVLRQLTVGFLGLTLVLAGLHVASAHGFITGLPAWFFSMESMYGAAGLFFLVLSVLILICLSTLGVFASNRLQSIYIAGAIIFWIAAIVYKYHFAWQFGFPYNPFSALVLSIAFILLALRFSHEDYRLLLVILTGAGLLMAGYWQHIWDLRQSQMAVYFSMMLIGMTILLAGLSVYLYRQFNPQQIRWYRRLSWGGVLATAVTVILLFWVAPMIEARFFAERINVDYLDGDLSLVGYRLVDDHVQPGADVQIILYWRANRFLPTGYGASINLLTQPDISSLNADNIPLLHWINTDAWIPGMVMRQGHVLQVPVDVPVPSGLLLQGTAWWADNGESIPVSNYGDQASISETAFILDRLTVTAPTEAPDTTTTFDFSDGFSLVDYQLPETADAGETLELSFTWQSNAEIQRDLTQFLHLYPTGGDEYAALFDHRPLNGRFPTIDWKPDTYFEDSVQITLPDDLAPGEYILYTGMYDPLTVERVLLLTENEQVSDHRVVLGRIEVR